jgi:hypothetical protein
LASFSPWLATHIGSFIVLIDGLTLAAFPSLPMACSNGASRMIEESPASGDAPRPIAAAISQG